MNPVEAQRQIDDILQQVPMPPYELEEQKTSLGYQMRLIIREKDLFMYAAINCTRKTDEAEERAASIKYLEDLLKAEWLRAPRTRQLFAEVDGFQSDHGTRPS